MPPVPSLWPWKLECKRQASTERIRWGHSNDGGARNTTDHAPSSGTLELGSAYWQDAAKRLLTTDVEEGPPQPSPGEENSVKFHDNGDGTVHMLGVDNWLDHRSTSATVGLCGCITIQTLQRILFTKVGSHRANRGPRSGHPRTGSKIDPWRGTPWTWDTCTAAHSSSTTTQRERPRADSD